MTTVTGLEETSESLARSDSLIALRPKHLKGKGESVYLLFRPKDTASRIKLMEQAESPDDLVFARNLDDLSQKLDRNHASQILTSCDWRHSYYHYLTGFENSYLKAKEGGYDNGQPCVVQLLSSPTLRTCVAPQSTEEALRMVATAAADGVAIDELRRKYSHKIDWLRVYNHTAAYSRLYARISGDYSARQDIPGFVFCHATGKIVTESELSEKQLKTLKKQDERREKGENGQTPQATLVDKAGIKKAIRQLYSGALSLKRRPRLDAIAWTPRTSLESVLVDIHGYDRICEYLKKTCELFQEITDNPGRVRRELQKFARVLKKYMELVRKARGRRTFRSPEAYRNSSGPLKLPRKYARERRLLQEALDVLFPIDPSIKKNEVKVEGAK